jgi:hypothetical protein
MAFVVRYMVSAIPQTRKVLFSVLEMGIHVMNRIAFLAKASCANAYLSCLRKSSKISYEGSKLCFSESISSTIPRSTLIENQKNQIYVLRLMTQIFWVMFPRAKMGAW